jgi:hypothetical protein
MTQSVQITTKMLRSTTVARKSTTMSQVSRLWMNLFMVLRAVLQGEWKGGLPSPKTKITDK